MVYTIIAEIETKKDKEAEEYIHLSLQTLNNRLKRHGLEGKFFLKKD